MLTVNDIKNVKFRRTNIGGYKTEDVDKFLDTIESSYEKLQNENLDLLQKIKILADRVNQYRKDEDSVKMALVSAQKLADSSVKEAKIEAEYIIENAKKEAQVILNKANYDIRAQKDTLINLKKSVKDFRANILSLYKEHLKLINSFGSEGRVPQNCIDEKNKKEPQNHVKKEVLKETLNADSQLKNDKSEKKTENKFTDLKFGENYDISKESEVKESPLGLFD